MSDIICPKCHGVMFGVEYDFTHPERYDGVSEWLCNKDAGGCGYRRGRWSGKELKDGEYEKRFALSSS